MKKILAVLLVLILTACTLRMGAFAPRRPDIPEHRDLVSADCLECHDLAGRQDHKSDDDCLRCHHLVKGI